MAFKNEAEMEKHWTNEAKRQLLGRRIVDVRYMNHEEMAACGWYSRPVVITLDNGQSLWSSSDDEGNNAGALFTTDDKQPTLPVL